MFENSMPEKESVNLWAILGGVAIFLLLIAGGFVAMAQSG